MIGVIELLQRSIKKRGIFKTLLISYYELVFDYINKTDTSAEFTEAYQNAEDRENFIADRQGVNPWILKKCFKALKKAGVGVEKSSFVDLGSGKGRALLIAAQSGFQKVVGIELNKKSCTIAANNLKIFESVNGYNNYQIICGDVVDYFPTDNFDVVFLYNPFGTKVLEKILSRLVRVKQDVRSTKCMPVFVIYVNPLCKEVFDIFGIKPLVNIDDEAIIYRID